MSPRALPPRRRSVNSRLLAADTRRWAAGRGSETLRQIANRRDLNRENLAGVESPLPRLVKTQPREQILARIIVNYPFRHVRIVADLGVTDERGAFARAYPDDHRAAAAYTPRDPRTCARLNQYRSIRR